MQLLLSRIYRLHPYHPKKRAVEQLWVQHPPPLLAASSEKSQLFEAQDEINSCTLIWSQLAFHTLKCQPLPFYVKRSQELEQAGKRNITSSCPDAFLTSKDIILMLVTSKSCCLSCQTQESMKKWLSCLDGQVNTSGSQRNLWWSQVVFPVTQSWSLVLTFFLCCYFWFSSYKEDESCNSFHHIFH